MLSTKIDETTRHLLAQGILMYKLTDQEIKDINDILDACDDHPGFIQGKDVAKIGEILLRLFSKDSKPAPKKAPAKKSPTNVEGNE